MKLSAGARGPAWIRIGLARRRDEDHVFRLTEWADGELSLQDLSTSKKIELEAFGPTNRDVFAHLLDPTTAGNGR